ncbi:MAG: zinc ribbon domain-containing protein, partial [Candidatus Brocadia sp.]
MKFAHLLILSVIMFRTPYDILLAGTVNKETQNHPTTKEAALKTQENVSKNKLCPECKRIYPGDVNFCSVDGKQLTEISDRDLMCPTCKEKANPGEKFCKKDGTPLINISSPEEKTTNESHTGATLEELANKA